MARPREFDETTVLDAAARQFRVYGFADTSTEQLCEAAGVRRSSLYNAFTSKDELFIRSLERHILIALKDQEVILTRCDLSGFARIEALFDLVLQDEDQARTEGHAAGCMIVASRMAPAIGSRNPRIQQLLDRYLERQLKLIGEAVAAGRRDGSLRNDLSVDEAAMMLAAFISGIRVMSQSGVEVSSLRRTTAVGLQGLRAQGSQ